MVVSLTADDGAAGSGVTRVLYSTGPSSNPKSNENTMWGTYTDEDKADFQESLSAQVEQMGGDEVFETWLKSMCLTREGFENMSSVTYINQHMADGMYREGTDLAPTPEGLRTYADENDYLAAKHTRILQIIKQTICSLIDGEHLIAKDIE